MSGRGGGEHVSAIWLLIDTCARDYGRHRPYRGLNCFLILSKLCTTSLKVVNRDATVVEIGAIIASRLQRELLACSLIFRFVTIFGGTRSKRSSLQ